MNNFKSFFNTLFNLKKTQMIKLNDFQKHHHLNFGYVHIIISLNYYLNLIYYKIFKLFNFLFVRKELFNLI